MQYARASVMQVELAAGVRRGRISTNEPGTAKISISMLAMGAKEEFVGTLMSRAYLR